jgi:hypothetical protein
VILLFTDYGHRGAYVAEVTAVLRRETPGVDVIALISDAPAYHPRAAAYLLAAYAEEFPRGSVFLCVVDPGVGTERGAGILRADGRWYVGPDNGLFELIIRRADRAQWWPLPAPKAPIPATFHGRDWFAGVAARLARGAAPPGRPGSAAPARRPDWPDDLSEIISIDGFGNAMSGVRASGINRQTQIIVDQHRLRWARTFADVPLGAPFWYENPNGLVEISVNQGCAARLLALSVGTPIELAV